MEAPTQMEIEQEKWRATKAYADMLKRCQNNIIRRPALDEPKCKDFKHY